MVSEEGQRSKGHGLVGGSTVDAPEFCKSVFSMLVFQSIRFFHAGFSTNQVVSYGNFSQSVFVPMSFANQIRLATVSKYGFASDIVSQSILGEKISL